MITDLFARDALLPTGWARDVRLSLASDGTLQAVHCGASPHGAHCLNGPVLPGMPNLHSHAFQRAMAGLAEAAGGSGGSFWSWRERMYELVACMTPEHVQAVAAYLYMEMLKAGFTSVAEFHYLHHDRQGRRYDDPAENAERLMAAAEAAGIGQTLMPVLYSYGGFGAQPPARQQRRFVLDCDDYAALWQSLRARAAGRSRQSLALCFHSLRAVSREQMESVLALDDEVPVHIHIAEQQAEVDACRQWSGQRPIDWLFDRVPVDARWCLVHATHATTAELQRIAASGAVAGLCPMTEANLGDGIFPVSGYVAAGGRFGIGSDSHIGVSVAEELRWLEYIQRLVSQQRIRLAGGGVRSVGRFLYEQALAGGSQALGQPVGRIEPGHYADVVVLDAKHPFVAAGEPEHLIDRWVFAHDNTLVSDVYVHGRRMIAAGHHPREEEFAAAFLRVLQELS